MINAKPKDLAIMITEHRSAKAPMVSASKPKLSISDLLSGKSSKADDDEADESQQGLEDAIKSFFEAGKSEDWSAASEALGDMMDLCSMREHEDETPYLDDDDKHAPMLDDDR